MEYSNPCGSSQPPFLMENMSGSQFILQDDLLDFNLSWVESIDPVLRDQNQPIHPSLRRPQQHSMQRFMGESERAYFIAPSYIAQNSRTLACGMVGPSIPVSTLPQAPRARMGSPAPSQDLRSTCSSERSPCAGEPENYQEMSYYSPQQDISFSLSDAAVGPSGGYPDSWGGQQVFPQLVNHNCVNMSQVCLIPDPQEVNYQADEGFMDIDLKSDYHLEVDAQHFKSEEQQSYQYPSDEGIGSSIKDGGSPEDSTTIKVDTGSVYDEDADGDADDIIVVEDAADTEYSPRSRRSCRRRTSKPTTLSTVKRSRIAKPIAKTKGKLQCPVCDHNPFKEPAALRRHVAGCHTRAFVCVFDFAGCSSTFASKNEWKRHVSSQHLGLCSWICTLGDCGKAHSKTGSSAGGGGGVKGSEFNRKDLFTQHLRRMHTPSHLERMTKKDQQWEETLKTLQNRCMRYKRQPPTRLACPLDVCDGIFEGPTCWDDRMEHVGKHLEKAGNSMAAGKESPNGGVMEIRQVDDDLLVNWAVAVGIVERRAGGGFKLSGVGAAGNFERRGGRGGRDHGLDGDEDDEEDADAYGEEE